MTIRDATPNDAEEIGTLYYETIHTVNRRDYSAEQVDAWAPPGRDPAGWAARQVPRRVFVAEEDGRIVGFAELDDTVDGEESGHIDCFYCHRDRQGKGVGTALMDAVVAEAKRRALARLHAEVSITARPFFERHGFRVLAAQTVEVRGVMLPNYRMERELAPAPSDGTL